MPTPIPAGFHTLTPHIIVRKAAEAIEFYKQAFGAREITRLMTPDGSLVIHALLKIGDSQLMMADEFPEGQACPGWSSPQHLVGTTVALHLYVEDVDAAYKQALAAGCRSAMPPADTFWGDRYSQVFDPFGHTWGIATHQVDKTPEEVAEAAAKMFGS